MPKYGAPSWLVDASKSAQHVVPVEASTGTLNALRQQLHAAKNLGRLAGEVGDSYLASANHQIGSALQSAVAAQRWDDDMVHLLNYPTNDRAISRAALSYRLPGYLADPRYPITHDGVYIESLGSTEKGLGHAALFNVADRYPDNPLLLESLPLPDTMKFYRNRGFQQLDENPTGGSLPFFYLPRGADLKAHGGSVVANRDKKHVEALLPVAVGGLRQLQAAPRVSCEA